MKNLLAVVILTIISSSAAMAFDDTADKLKLDRNKYPNPLTKGDVVLEIKKKYTGRILSVSTDTKGGNDCHIVKLLTPSSEFKTIYIECDKY